MKNLPPKIIFEDKVLMVLNKPAGLIVDRSSSNREKTLQDWLEERQRTKGSKNKTERSGIVHRLDKETSGLLLVAKTADSQTNLQAQFKQRLVKKTYLALVWGQVKPKKGTISAPISRSPFDRRKFGVFLGGRDSVTGYLALEQYLLDGDPCTLIELYPKTGRTHQLRVHLKHLGYPIIGDAKYGGRKLARKSRQWCPRQFLHASQLSFRHPVSGKRLEFKSRLPRELEKLLVKT